MTVKEAHRMGTDDRPTLMVYERPTLLAAGSFKKVTGLGCSGPRDVVFNKQCL
jgi:Family of unknown function (DUF5972)